MFVQKQPWDYETQVPCSMGQWEEGEPAARIMMVYLLDMSTGDELPGYVILYWMFYIQWYP